MRKSLEDMQGIDIRKSHYSKVPIKYQEYEYFIEGIGYAVMCVPSQFLSKILDGSPYWDWEVTIPVGYFLRNTETIKEHEGFLTIDIEYDPMFGAIVQDGDYIWKDE